MTVGETHMTAIIAIYILCSGLSGIFLASFGFHVFVGKVRFAYWSRVPVRGAKARLLGAFVILCAIAYSVVMIWLVGDQIEL
jgi:hypothetical protein